MNKSTFNSIIHDYIDGRYNMVVLTGAGVSVLSGIPDYRSKNGIYEKTKSPEKILSHETFLNDYNEFNHFIKKNMYFPNAKPNKVHEFIAELEKNHSVTVITQNIDGLHKQAGSTNVIEFHGTINESICEHCEKKYSIKDFLLKKKCCGNYVKPHFVLYDEPIDNLKIAKSIDVIRNADVIMIIGTSLMVEPFRSLIEYKSENVPIVYINKENKSNLQCDLYINEDFKNLF